MVTGVEAAGLALAIFPLVVNGLSCYLDGIQKIREAKNFRGVLKRLIRGFDIEKIKFQNTCESFLEGMVSAEDMEALVAGVGWGRPEFKIILLGRLRENAAVAFVAAVEDLTESLQNLGKDLGLDENYKLVLDDKRLQRKHLDKLKIVLDKGKHRDTLQDISRINADLENLTMQRTKTPLPKPIAKSHAAKRYNCIRSQARSLHGVLQETFQTASCLCNHSANLQLENRTDQDNLKFKVLFNFQYIPTAEASYPRGWRALEFQPVDCKKNTTEPEPCEEDSDQSSVEETTFRSILNKVKGVSPKKTLRFEESPRKNKTKVQESPDTLQQIKDLCFSIKEAMTSSSDCCIGVLEDEPKGLSHRIWPPVKLPSPYCDLEPVSLDTLLFPGSLEEVDRLKLGVKIASAVMHLHATEWLSESWGTKDIFFLQKSKSRRATTGGIVTISEPELAMPFVRRMLGSSQELYSLQQTEKAPETTALIEYDKSLFSLGIVLIELWFEQPLNNLRADRNQPSGDDADYETAQQQVAYLLEHAGEDYWLAVSRCINGLKGRTIKSKPIKSVLTNADFKNDVHENVVCLLQRNLEVFSKAYE